MRRAAPPSRADHTSTWGHGAWCRWGPGTASSLPELPDKDHLDGVQL